MADQVGRRRKALAFGCATILAGGAAFAVLLARSQPSAPMIELLTRPESDQCLLVVKCLEYRMSLDDLTIADATTGALLLRAQAEQAKARPTHVPFDATTDLIGEIEKQGWRVSDALEKPVPLISGKPYRVELTAGDCFGGTRRPATSDVVVLPRRP